MKLRTCLLLVSSVAWPVQINFSKAEFKSGDLIRVTVIKEPGDRFLRTYENGKRRIIYRDKDNPYREKFHFFTGFDVEHHVNRIAITVVSAKGTLNKKVWVSPKTLKHGEVKITNSSALKVLNRPKSDYARENRFFHQFFVRESKVQHWRGKWIVPVKKARLSSEYGKKRVYPNGRVTYHRGVDFAAPLGTQVRAANHGVVVYAGRKMVRGNIVVIDHGCGLYTSYWHLHQYLVYKGMKIRKGTVIGKVGKTGLASGPHLHWDVRIRNVSVDGTQLLDL